MSHYHPPTPTPGLGFILAEDNALKSLLGGIHVHDEKGGERGVQVWFANPDVESRQQSYPYLTIELMGVDWANYRQHSGMWYDSDNQGTTPEVDGVVYTYEMPTTWDLTYQITSYARHPRHDRIIINHLLSNDFVAKRGFLPVYNELGTEIGYRHLVLESFAKRDTIEDGRRLFRNVFTVTVSSESLSGDGEEVFPVQSVLINNDPNYVPDDLLLP